MKKFTDYLKSNILVVFGALMLVYHLNYLSYGGAALAIGIIATIISAYYISAGILISLAGNKLSPSVRKIFGLLSVTLFAVFMFVVFLMTIITASSVMGPAAWTMNILSMAAALAFIVLYVVSEFSCEPFVRRLAYLFSLIFVLALLSDLLFDVNGNSKPLGSIDVLSVVIYGLYAFFLFNSVDKPENFSKRKKPARESKSGQEEIISDEEVKGEEGADISVSEEQ